MGMVTFEIPAYNDRRYSKPWGAVVVFNGSRADYEFKAGNYLGDAYGGEVVITCKVGDIVATGQKDNRKSSGTTNEWYVIGEGMSKTPVTKPEAFKHWTAKHGEPVMQREVQ